MAEFKPMVKMETTEPSVILKLKKGGHVNMKKGGSADKDDCGHSKMAMGGVMGKLASTPAFLGRPAMNAMVKSPGKPSMSDRRKAMMANPAMPSTPPMKKGGKAMKMAEGGKADMEQDKAMIKKAFKQHDAQEHKGAKGTTLKLKKGGDMCGGGKMATGGVAMSNAGGYKKGGTIPQTTAKKFLQSNMVTTKKMAKGGTTTDANCNPYVQSKMMSGTKKATGGVAMSNAGGYKNGGMSMVEKNGKMVPDFAADGKGKMKKGGMATGGVSMSNAGGFKKGGSTKKAYATGGTVDSGRAVAMPQGNVHSGPKRQVNFSGTYKTGGNVKKMAVGGPSFAQQMERMSASDPDLVQRLRNYQSQGTNFDNMNPMQRGMFYNNVRDQREQANRPPPPPPMPQPQNTAMPARPMPSPAMPARPMPSPAMPARPMPSSAMPTVGIVPKPAIATAPNVGAPRVAPAPRSDVAQMLAKTKSAIGAQPSLPKKKGGGVGYKGPQMKNSKMDDNLKYPATMESPQKTPKFK
jgi:hypothetical protein